MKMYVSALLQIVKQNSRKILSVIKEAIHSWDMILELCKPLLMRKVNTWLLCLV